MFSIENTVQDTMELNAERIFGWYYTGDNSRHSEGTGLGLAVVKLLVEKINGQIFATLQSNLLSITVMF